MEEGERGSSQDITQGSRHSKPHSPPLTHPQAQFRPNSPHVKMHRHKQGCFFCLFLCFFCFSYFCKKLYVGGEPQQEGKVVPWWWRRASTPSQRREQSRHKGQKKSGRPEIPTRSLYRSSVLVVFLQPGCQTVDPGEGGQSVHLHLLQTGAAFMSQFFCDTKATFPNQYNCDMQVFLFNGVKRTSRNS